jgi:hypothetical protein
MTGNRRSFNRGDWLHLVQIAVMLFTMGIAWAKIQSAAEQSSRNAHTLERVEHYLSSRDPEYWQRAKEEPRATTD